MNNFLSLFLKKELKILKEKPNINVDKIPTLLNFIYNFFSQSYKLFL